jgi:hypothetical protein
MRNVSKVVIAAAIVMALAVPAQAAPRDGGRWFDRTFDPIVKVIKKFVIRTTGDGLGDPWPKP